MGLFLEPFPYVWPRMDRLTYSPIVKGILESEGKIAGCPRTPAMAPTFHKQKSAEETCFSIFCTIWYNWKRNLDKQTIKIWNPWSNSNWKHMLATTEPLCHVSYSRLILWFLVNYVTINMLRSICFSIKAIFWASTIKVIYQMI